MFIRSLVNITDAIKYKSREDEVKKKGLPATPSSTLPWSAKRLSEFTDCEICIWLHHIYIPVVIARPFSALPPCYYAMIDLMYELL